MRPLVLREIANTLGLHESTVSRVTTRSSCFTRAHFRAQILLREHVATRREALFGDRYPGAAQAAGCAEDARKPLSDSKISEILSQQGIVVARRTIAKYRESMQIPP